MTKKEFKEIDKSEENLISAEDLKPFVKDRTLLYGYTCDRKNFHVYLKNMEIHTVVYGLDYSTGEVKPKDMREIPVVANHDYIPDKRLYPEACDYQFCKLLKNCGFDLPFTVFTGTRPVREFYGFTLEDH